MCLQTAGHGSPAYSRIGVPVPRYVIVLSASWDGIVREGEMPACYNPHTGVGAPDFYLWSSPTRWLKKSLPLYPAT
jgi:hypothetical protein